MLDNKFKAKATKNKATNQNSIVKELQHHISFHRVVAVKAASKEKIFNDLIFVLKNLYGAPKEDFTKVDHKFTIDKDNYQIITYEPFWAFEVQASINDRLHNIRYEINKSLVRTKLYKIHYYDFATTPKPIEGLKGTLIKLYSKRLFYKNAQKIKQALKILNSKY